jgi:hypothetical protein
VKDGSRQEKRLVLLAAIFSSALDIVSLPIALVRAHLRHLFVLHFSFCSDGFNLGTVEHLALLLGKI